MKKAKKRKSKDANDEEKPIKKAKCEKSCNEKVKKIQQKRGKNFILK